jgi:hypothetical protein
VMVSPSEIVEKEFLVIPLIPAKSAADPGTTLTTTSPRSTPCLCRMEVQYRM